MITDSLCTGSQKPTEDCEPPWPKVLAVAWSPVLRAHIQRGRERGVREEGGGGREGAHTVHVCVWHARRGPVRVGHAAWLRTSELDRRCAQRGPASSHTGCPVPHQTSRCDAGVRTFERSSLRECVCRWRPRRITRVLRMQRRGSPIKSRALGQVLLAFPELPPHIAVGGVPRASNWTIFPSQTE